MNNKKYIIEKVIDLETEDKKMQKYYGKVVEPLFEIEEGFVGLFIVEEDKKDLRTSRISEVIELNGKLIITTKNSVYFLKEVGLE